jgi:hypothetical protein
VIRETENDGSGTNLFYTVLTTTEMTVCPVARPSWLLAAVTVQLGREQKFVTKVH